MRKTIMALAVIGMFLCVASITIACTPEPRVEAFVGVKSSGDADITIRQISKVDNVLMQADVKTDGKLDLTQKLTAKSCGFFSKTTDELVNKIDANGRGIDVNSVVGNSEGYLHFNAQLKMAESSSNNEGMQSRQVFTKTKQSWFSTDVFKMIQKFQICPTDVSPEIEPDKLKNSNIEGIHKIGSTKDTMMYQKIRGSADLMTAMQRIVENGDVTSSSSVVIPNSSAMNTIEMMMSMMPSMP